MPSYTIAQGDRDCSSAVISAYQAVGLSVNATYTGNMKSGFLATGKFEWQPMSFIAQRGDIYLNESQHTAMCTSATPDMLAEFSGNENGGITGGTVGDQTGRESRIRSYYDDNWDGILHCTDSYMADQAAQVMEHLCECPLHGYAQDARWGNGSMEMIYTDGEQPTPSPQPEPSGDEPRYNIYAGGRWFSDMLGTVDTGGSSDDFAGSLGTPAEYFAIEDCEYQVYVDGKGWLPTVSQRNLDDFNYGCAGDGTPIKGLRILNNNVRYCVHVLGGGWYSELVGTYDTGGSGDDYAGDLNNPIDGIRCQRA